MHNFQHRNLLSYVMIWILDNKNNKDNQEDLVYNKSPVGLCHQFKK